MKNADHRVKKNGFCGNLEDREKEKRNGKKARSKRNRAENLQSKRTISKFEEVDGILKDHQTDGQKVINTTVWPSKSGAKKKTEKEIIWLNEENECKC